MMKKESAVINPMQLRLPPKMKEKIAAAADKSFRTIHSEVLYRLNLLDELEAKGEITLQ